MSGRSKKEVCLFLYWRLCLQTSGILSLSCHPRLLRSTGGAKRCPPLPGLAPESALRLHPCRALSSAPASTSVKEEFVLEKLVVVVDREK
jgi:hypothetical protein